jgi:hypothetical protein
MDEQFDKKLTNHIREVFDNYEHPGSEQGWAQLKNKLPGKEKSNKVAWIWWCSAAAVILVFLCIGIFYSNQPATTDTIAAKPIKQQQPVIIKSTKVDKSPVDTSINANVIAGSKTLLLPNHKALHAPYLSQTPELNTTLAIRPQKEGTTVIATPAATLSKQPQVATNALAASDTQRIATNIAAEPELTNADLPVKNRPLIKDETSAIVTAPESQSKTMANMFENDKQQRLAKRKDPERNDTKKVNFSIYAATYFNYAEGSTNQVNAGAGFTSDYRISSKLKLSTGINIAQNTLSYNTSAPPTAKALVASAQPLHDAALFATSAVLPIFKNYNANLVGLDIPINITYEFNPQKSSAYISAGLSSGTFIDESYSYKYTYGNGASANSNGQAEQTAHNSFNSFYFGKTLNFSFGVGYPLGSNRLIIEPFVKYPLGGLGAQDIRFGAGGVNLKFSFKTQKGR